MKKATIFMTALATLMCATSLATPKTTQAAEAVQSDDLTKYYDLNDDGEFSITDAVLANQLLDEGSFSKNDFLNVCNLVVGNEVNMNFEEFDLDGMENNRDSIFKLQSLASSYCVGYEFDGITVTYRFLNDGVVSEMHCSDIDITETAVAVLTFDGKPNIVGITPDGKLALDVAQFYSRDMEIKPFKVIVLDDLYYMEANSLMYTSGKYENFLVTPYSGNVQIWFDNGLTITELRVNRVAPIVKELKSFVYENEKITVGVTADGKVAVDTYSFDPVE